MPAEVRVSTGYQPRPYQAQLHRGLKRFNVLVAHRRFGKTVFCINELIDRCLRCDKERPRYGYLAPFRNQAKGIAWDYLQAYTRPIPGTEFNQAELRADLPGGRRIQLFGADNPDAMRGLYFDGVVLDEYAQMEPRVWTEIIRPALADRKGWAVFIGTPMGRNAFWQIYDQAGGDPEWFAAMFKASETGIIDPGELTAARKVMSPEQYAQEFECSFQAAIVGAYYGKELKAAEDEKRIGKVPWEPTLEVHTAWDLGIGDSTAIWFAQRHGRETRIIDYYEASGAALSHYVKMLRDKPYIYGRHFLPHDVEVKELGTGQSRREMLASLGLKCDVLPQSKVEDGIEAVRNLIPQCWFDAEKCHQGIEALRQYRREFDDKLKAFKVRPLHDWTSHASDSMRYLAMGLPRIGGWSSASADIPEDDWVL